MNVQVPEIYDNIIGYAFKDEKGRGNGVDIVNAEQYSLFENNSFYPLSNNRETIVAIVNKPNLSNQRKINILNTLRNNGVDILIDYEVLEWAVKTNNTAVIDWFITIPGIDIEVLFDIVAMYGDITILRHLYNRFPRAQGVTQGGFTGIVASDRLDILRYLLEERDFVVNRRNGLDAFNRAIFNLNLEMLQLMYNHGIRGDLYRARNRAHNAARRWANRNPDEADTYNRIATWAEEVIANDPHYQ